VMKRIIRIASIVIIFILLNSCRESVPGKYSYQHQLAEEIEQTLEVNDEKQSSGDEEHTEMSGSEEVPETEEVQTAENQVEIHATPSPKQWSYKGEHGPQNWGQLNPEYALCKNGTMQSPVDIANVTIEVMPSIQFAYQTSNISIRNNGNLIQVIFEHVNSINIDGTVYHLKELLFHGPSEHTLNGQYLSMEIHLLHEDDAGNYAVVAVFIQPGMINEAMNPIIENLPENEEDFLQPVESRMNPEGLLPDDRSYYYVDGSLTTPPCTEGVKWYILKKPIELSVLQIAQLESVYINNHRPTQPLNNRIIREQGN